MGPVVAAFGLATSRPLLLVAGFVAVLDHLVGVARRGPSPLASLIAVVTRVLRWTLTTVSLGLVYVVVMLLGAVFAIFAVPARLWSQRPSAAWRRASYWGRVPAPEPSRRPFAATPPLERRVRRTMAIGGVALVLLVLAVAVWPGAGQLSDLLRGSAPEVADAPSVDSFSPVDLPALRDQPHVVESFQELEDSWSRVEYSPFTEWKVPDYKGKYVNVTDGQRASWQGPASDGALDVVFLGGSTMYGFGLRDDFTIPSAFAKRAAEAGIPVRVHNYGVPAFVSYQEALLYDRLAADGVDADLVITYDGFNDTVMQMTARYFTELPQDGPSHGFAPMFEQTVRDAGGGQPSEPIGRPSSDAQLDAVIDGYKRGQALIADVAARTDTPVVAFWQPVLATRTPADPAQAEIDRGLDTDAFLSTSNRRLFDAVRNRVPDTVHDLSGVFDDETESVFYDYCHINEAGADIVGSAIFDQVEPQLKQLAGG